MVNLGKAASRMAKRQQTRVTSRAKSKARLNARAIGNKAKKAAATKVADKRAGDAETDVDANLDAGDGAEFETELVSVSAGEHTGTTVRGAHGSDASHGAVAYPTTQIPVGFQPPRGLKLINDPDEIPEPFDWSKVPWKKILIVLGILIAATLLTLGLRWAVPKVVDLVRDVEVTVPTLPTMPTVPVVTEPPVVVLTVWGEGSCVTTDGAGAATPSTCNEADLEVTRSIAYPDLELSREEVRGLQELMTSLGVTVIIDGILGPQTRLALDSFAVSAGLEAGANDRAKAAAVRAASLSTGFAPDGPRLIQTSPEVCGAGVQWVEDLTAIHCLGDL